jgi:hypothetical protein
MALAEIGDYGRAAAIQRGVMAAAAKAGLDADVQRIAANLRRYEGHEPCCVPWTEEEAFKGASVAADANSPCGPNHRSSFGLEPKAARDVSTGANE